MTCCIYVTSQEDDEKADDDEYDDDDEAETPIETHHFASVKHLRDVFESALHLANNQRDDPDMSVTIRIDAITTGVGAAMGEDSRRTLDGGTTVQRTSTCNAHRTDLFNHAFVQYLLDDHMDKKLGDRTLLLRYLVSIRITIILAEDTPPPPVPPRVVVVPTRRVRRNNDERNQQQLPRSRRRHRHRSTRTTSSRTRLERRIRTLSRRLPRRRRHHRRPGRRETLN